MDDMILLTSEYLFFFVLIGITSSIYVSCFLSFEKHELKKFIKDEIQKQLKDS